MKKSFFNRFLVVVLLICVTFSLFGIGKVLAYEPTFKLSNATIVDKSEGVEASIVEFTDSELVTNVVYHKLDDVVS